MFSITNRFIPILLTLILTAPALAQFEWVTIESGKFGGFGFAQTRWTAIDRCAKDVENKFIALAQRCCESTETTTSARFGNRCAGGYSGPKNNRSFFGGVAAYFCWPDNTEQQMATGYWLVTSATRDYTCQELMDVSVPVPPPPAPTPTPSPSPTMMPLPH